MHISIGNIKNDFLQNNLDKCFFKFIQKLFCNKLFYKTYSVGATQPIFICRLYKTTSLYKGHLKFVDNY